SSGSGAGATGAPSPAPPPAPVKPATPKDNPYKRRFGRLSIGELESKITETEIELAELQAQFGETAIARDPSAAKKLQADFDETQRTLKELEQEYFTRSDG
ncbi:MAG TPA: ABC transporter C-terminal domain-containing protein, partial [Tepidisphaeraceae bacterium]|nr:ABC transporter C-terminal domain-containing protein [Tepidisphaeraceae bacterium]